MYQGVWETHISAPATSRQGVSELSQVGVKAWSYRGKVLRSLAQSGSLTSLLASPHKEVRMNLARALKERRDL